MRPIKRAAVLGAGVMGSGIAAHFANAGLRVLLLDIVPPDLPADKKNDRAARNAFAAGGLKKALKSKPAAFFDKGKAAAVTVGNLEDDLDKLADCDLVIEAIVERMDIKRSLFEKLEKVVADHTIIASNTSGLRISEMLDGRAADFRKRFVVMHFFNPVRYMKLLELVPGVDTDPDVLARVRHFGEEVLGKGIVVGKDTPNFVGNRIGSHAMLYTVHQMLEADLLPEDIDAITGVAMAHPKSASFRTADLVGLDTFLHVAHNCYVSLTEDEERDVFKAPEVLVAMAEKKILGNKTRGGFYKKTKAGIQTIDLKTFEYRDRGGDPEIKKVCKTIAKIEDPRERVKKLVADPGVAGKFAWTILSRSLAYSARRLGEITDSITDIDAAMRWGYSWELGPFQTWDALGFVETTERMEKDGIDLPDCIKKMKAAGKTSFYGEDGTVYEPLAANTVTLRVDPRHATLQIMRSADAPVLKNSGAEAWDLGDGVLGLTFKTKANSVDADVIGMLHQTIERAETDFDALVIANQGEHFCVGANLFAVVMGANQKQWEPIREMIKGFQGANQRLKYSSIPVVAAPYGMTLGGGLEICLGSDAVQAAAETYSGLVEVAVGLIPGGGGTLNLLWRALEGIPDGTQAIIEEYVAQVFKNIALAKVATSADEAKSFGYFRLGDGVSFDRDRQLAEAKARAIGMAKSGYHAPVPRTYRLPGESGAATLRMMVDTLVAGGHASEHDALIAGKLATVLCGGAGGAGHEVTEEHILELEAEVFLSLCGETKSLERMQHMLMKNKPLRN